MRPYGRWAMVAIAPLNVVWYKFKIIYTYHYQCTFFSFIHVIAPNFFMYILSQSYRNSERGKISLFFNNFKFWNQSKFLVKKNSDVKMYKTHRWSLHNCFHMKKRYRWNIHWYLALILTLLLISTKVLCPLKLSFFKSTKVLDFYFNSDWMNANSQ